jgi:DNA-binding NarL/FixJ family response regulator
MRVLLTNDQTQVRSALRRLLEQESELSVVGEAGEAEDLLAQVQETRPDLVLLDWELPGLQATDLLLAMHSRYCPLKVVAFSEHKEARQEALDAGADAFISKDDPQERLLITLRAVGGLSPCFVG